MGVWIMMSVIDLAFPAFLIVYGSIYMKKTPEDMNGSNGYKTARARLSRETWEFANHYAARITRAVGWALLAVFLAAMLFLRGKDSRTVSDSGTAILLMDIFILVFSTVFPTEAALKKNFDENGNRRPR